MKSRVSLISGFAWAAICSGLAFEKPNLGLIMCDDMGFSDIGCYGGEIDAPSGRHWPTHGLAALCRTGVQVKSEFNRKLFIDRI